MNDNVRLGYACVNMTLSSRPKKLGGPVTTSRTLRKATWQPTWDLKLVGERALLNANDLLHYLQWNQENKFPHQIIWCSFYLLTFTIKI